MRMLTILPVLIFFLVAGLAHADDDDAPRTISVTGSGSVQAAPDLAEIDLGVATVAPEARAALTENNALAERVFAFLRESGVRDTDMQSIGLSVSPRFRDRRPGETVQPEIVGYAVNNSLRVRVRDLGSLGTILDGVVSAGANTINGIRFDVSERAELERRASASAVADAIARARNIARAADLSLGPVLSISEGFSSRPPQPFRALAEVSSVPVATGELTVGAQVSVVFAIR